MLASNLLGWFGMACSYHKTQHLFTCLAGSTSPSFVVTYSAKALASTAHNGLARAQLPCLLEPPPPPPPKKNPLPLQASLSGASDLPAIPPIRARDRVSPPSAPSSPAARFPPVSPSVSQPATAPGSGGARSQPLPPPLPAAAEAESWSRRSARWSTFAEVACSGGS